ncbi:MAG: tyrosine recombinase XerC [Rhodocyclaceae bacterium]|jgi:integrase/recombinase XerC|nr:tyrosine recombinase XerC [Rhodocyclaceae bacterium]
MSPPAGIEPATEPAIEQFLAELAHQRRASIHTLEAYRRDLLRLQNFAAERPLTTLLPAHIRRFAMQLHGSGLAARSIARVLSAWRSYYRWLVRRGSAPRNPLDGVRAPKAPRILPKALSVDQAKALLDGVPDGVADDVADCRDRAMFELFYSSGLRLSELTGLDVSGLDLREGEVTVTGKRSKTRTLPLGSKARAALSDWLACRGALAAVGETALFVGARGARIANGVVQKRLTQWAQRQGLGMHVHPHMLRHSFASHVLQSSGDLRAVQEMLGHANISTTQIYTHLDFQHLAKVYDAAHPRARKK